MKNKDLLWLIAQRAHCKSLLNYTSILHMVKPCFSTARFGQLNWSHYFRNCKALQLTEQWYSLSFWKNTLNLSNQKQVRALTFFLHTHIKAVCLSPHINSDIHQFNLHLFTVCGWGIASLTYCCRSSQTANTFCHESRGCEINRLCFFLWTKDTSVLLVC